MKKFDFTGPMDFAARRVQELVAYGMSYKTAVERCAEYYAVDERDLYDYAKTAVTNRKSPGRR